MAAGNPRQWRPSRGSSTHSSSAEAPQRHDPWQPAVDSGSVDARFARVIRHHHNNITKAAEEASSPSTSAMPPAADSFVPYLPQDDAVAAGLSAEEGAIDAVETQEVADLLNSELSSLLKMSSLEFWRKVSGDNSIQASLNSYLQFRRRWYDSYFDQGGNTIAGVIVGDQELHRRIFMVLYRMSSNLEPRVPARDCLSREEHAGIIQKKQLFNIPKLLDICAIYGCNNAELTRHLVSNVFSVLQSLNNDLAEVVPILAKTIHTMYQRCSSTLLMQLTSRKSETFAASKLQKEFSEVLYYLNDTVYSLQSFIDAYPDGAIILVSAGESNTREQLLPTLAVIHDALLPTMHKILSHIGTDPELHLKRIRVGLMELVWHVLCLSYLSETNMKDSLHKTLGDLQKTYSRDPAARGEAFVQVVSNMMVDPSQELINQSAGVKEELIIPGALLRNLARQRGIFHRLNQLQAKGLISLDSAQYDYLIALLMCYTSSNTSQASDFPAEHREMQAQEDDIMYESKISHIKDILPDYGNGFIAACLEAYDNNPEEVIQRILEGTLHPSLQSLDTSLGKKPDGMDTTQELKNKGKGKAVEAPLLTLQKSQGSSATCREAMDYRSSSSSISSAAQADAVMSMSSLSDSMSQNKLAVPGPAEKLKGRFVRKDKAEGNAVLFLDDRDAEDTSRTALYAAQYDDEYDDSFDDLGAHVADAVEETESLVDLIGSKSSRGALTNASKVHPRAQSDTFFRGARTAVNGILFEGEGRKSINQRTSAGKQVGNPLSDPNKQSPSQSSRARGRGRREEPRAQYFIKDGKNYSYKVAGSTAVWSIDEADALKKVDVETIHGLGQGGNLPTSVHEDLGGRSSRPLHGESSGRGGSSNNRGRGGHKKDHHRKDGAMKKHFASVGGM